jgi:hypothetical protein
MTFIARLERLFHTQAGRLYNPSCQVRHETAGARLLLRSPSLEQEYCNACSVSCARPSVGKWNHMHDGLLSLPLRASRITRSCPWSDRSDWELGISAAERVWCGVHRGIPCFHSILALFFHSTRRLTSFAPLLGTACPHLGLVDSIFTWWLRVLGSTTFNLSDWWSACVLPLMPPTSYRMIWIQLRRYSLLSTLGYTCVLPLLDSGESSVTKRWAETP